MKPNKAITNCYTFESEAAQERIKKILAFIAAAEGGISASRLISAGLTIHPTTTCTYLTGMHKLGLITPVKIDKTNGLHWKAGRDPKLEGKFKRPESKSGKPIVRQVNAADVKTPTPTDPMNAFLFGARRTV